MPKVCLCLREASLFSFYKVKSRAHSSIGGSAGWSLIELLIVLLILSGLMTLVMPQVLVVTGRAERMAAQQLLLEALSIVQLRHDDSIEESCNQFYQREVQRFATLELTLQCRALSKSEIWITGNSPVSGYFHLSSIHGFVERSDL